VVAVGIWYHVGSKDEPEGKTGFAHLFEHLMFEGSENFDQDISVALDRVGAASVNGTTWFDRTNYFETVPSTALEYTLWLESDRMGYLLGALTQEKLDQEREVVLNEKRQGDGQPYGMVNYRVLEGLFPPGHPYRHDSIGSTEDLEAASLDDVRQWFRDYYGAANTVLVLAGDVSAERAEQLVRLYFGPIPAGPPVARIRSRVPDRQNDTNEVLYDRVPQVRSLRNWAVPGRTERDFALLQLAARVLGDGKNSRLYQALVYEQQSVVDLSVRVQGQEIASIFTIDVTLKPGASLFEVNEIVDHELRLFRQAGPGEQELMRARSKINAEFLRGLEVVGGFDGKAATLAEGALYDGNPDFYRTWLDWINDAAPDEVRDAARRWIERGRHQVDILPYPDYEAAPEPVDRSSGPPEVTSFPAVRFPAAVHTRLQNGMPVVFAEWNGVPLVNVSIRFDAGFAADRAGRPGIASFALAMMDESTLSQSALEIDATAEALGAEIRTTSNLDMSGVTLSALTANLADSIELFADVVRNPAFAPDELERLRGRWLAGIEQEKSDPLQTALRILPPLLYGTNHAYGVPFTGSGTPESILSLSREDLLRFHREWLRPDNATLYAVGAVSLEELLPLLESAFGDWQAPPSAAPQKSITPIVPPENPRLILIDQPDSPQSVILAGQVAPPTGVDNNLAITLMNDIVGGEYLARMNRNLRGDKQWTYGAYSLLPDARGQRPWLVYAPVRTDRTAAAIIELIGELDRVLSTEPVTMDELQWARQLNVLSLPAQFETSQAILAALEANTRFGRDDEYVNSLKERYDSISLDQAQAASRDVLRPQSLVWVVVGDVSLLEPELRALGLAEPEYLDPDGNPAGD
jgi:zinc protease